MTQQEKVVDYVSRMILSLGVKSVRMDDVATDLGMSKRTLYELFGDKEELLYQSVSHLRYQRFASFSEQLSGCDNMLESLLKGIRMVADYSSINETEKRLAFNLKKFYPNVYERLQVTNLECSLAGLRYALDKCLEQGYIDPYVDVELMTRLFIMSVNSFMGEMKPTLPESITREEALGAMAVNFLRGVSTVKGLQVIDDILSREPRPKTLSERRAEQQN